MVIKIWLSYLWIGIIFVIKYIHQSRQIVIWNIIIIFDVIKGGRVLKLIISYDFI